jgi:uncharacterized protein Veg
MADPHEKFVAWYLRLNGYFCISSFIVHAADDPERVRSGKVGSYTESDILAIRMPYSFEQTSHLKIANHEKLVDPTIDTIDVVIGEVKSGRKNRPNKVWRNRDLYPIKYIIRFIGQYKDEDSISKAAESLAENYFHEDSVCRIRYIVFSNAPSDHWHKKGVSFITFDDIINFIVSIRGECWLTEGIGVASLHPQWDPLMNDIFSIANDLDSPTNERKSRIAQLFKK